MNSILAVRFAVKISVNGQLFTAMILSEEGRTPSKQMTRPKSQRINGRTCTLPALHANHCSQHFQHLWKVFSVLFYVLSEDQDVIKVNKKEG